MMARRRLLFVLALVLGIASAAAAQVPDWPSERPPRPLPAREVKFPPYEVRTLSNGLQVIAVFHHEQPAITLRLIVRAGAAQDPADKPGVAFLAASLLDQGTTTKNAEQIATSIDSIGGALGAGAATDLTFIQAAVMRDSLNTGLDLISDVARNPVFAPEEIDRQRQQVLSSLRVSYDDPDYLAGVVFDRLVFGFHPYGRPGTGTPETLSTVTRDDLIAFHKRWFGANNAILAIVGDTTPEEAFAGAERAFGKWERVEVPEFKPVEPPPPTRRVVVIDRPGAVQTEIRVGNIGLPRRHPDYLALDIATKILGGEGGNRLHRVLRSERGLTYGASADVNALKETGDIVAETDTRSETTAETLRLIVDEFWRIQRQRVQQRELSDAQAYLTGSFPLTIETPGAIALQVLNAVIYGLDLDELQTYRERVNAVTAEDIQRVAQQYLRPDRLTIVLVGDANVFAKQLAGVGFDQVERIPASELDLSSPDLRRRGGSPMRRQPVAYRYSADQSQAAPAPAGAAELVARAVRAKGGLDLLRSIRTVKISSVTTATIEKKPVSFQTLAWIQYPGRYRTDAETPSGVVTQVFDRGEFWVRTEAQGVQQAPAAVADTMRANIQRDVIPLLLAAADRKVPAKRLDDVTNEGRLEHVLELALPASPPVTLFLDARTSLIARMAYETATTDAPPGHARVEERYSDYRDVRGLQVAFKATVRSEAALTIERTLRSFDYNVVVDPKLFIRPS